MCAYRSLCIRFQGRTEKNVPKVKPETCNLKRGQGLTQTHGHRLKVALNLNHVKDSS